MAKQESALFEAFKAQRDDFEAWLKDRTEREDRASRTVKLTSLDALEPQTVTVEIERADGTILALPMRPLGYTEFTRIRLSIDDPTPPTNGFDAATKRPTFDYNEPNYRRGLQEAATRRSYAFLFACLLTPVPGDTLDERIAWLEARLDYAEVRQLIEVINQLASRGEGRIQHMADTFQRNGTGGGADLRTAEEERDVVLATA